MDRFTLFSCPGCQTEGFRSLMDVKEHFRQPSHSFQCPVCQKIFGDDMAVIQHYQKYKIAQRASTSMPSVIREISSPIQPPGGTTAISLPPMSNDQMNWVQNELADLKKTLQLIQENVDSTDSNFPTLPIASDETGPNGDFWPALDLDTQAYPVVLHPLEQRLVIRYLRSKCHSRGRLQTAGYVLEPDTLKNKQHICKGHVPICQFRKPPSVAHIQPDIEKRHAIAIDCEMVGVENNRQALAFISAVDFLTGELLISGYVVPSEEVLDYRSRITGITRAVMERARISGAAFSSWQEARESLWEFADDLTVFVGQSLNYDLEVLGICHSMIVDSAILTAEAVFLAISSSERLPRAWSLKVLAKSLLGLEIQNRAQAHSALEDAYAARDVVIFCIRNPEELKSWAELRRDEEERKLKEVQRKKKGKTGLNSMQYTRNVQHRAGEYVHDYEYDFDEHQDFRLSDYARGGGWPEGQDPW